jgi:hypothetical protein
MSSIYCRRSHQLLSISLMKETIDKPSVNQGVC